MNHSYLGHLQAGEALGAIGLEESLPLLEQYSRDSVPEVAETCSLAIDTIKYKLKHKGSKCVFSPDIDCWYLVRHD